MFPLCDFLRLRVNQQLSPNLKKKKKPSAKCKFRTYAWDSQGPYLPATSSYTNHFYKPQFSLSNMDKNNVSFKESLWRIDEVMFSLVRESLVLSKGLVSVSYYFFLFLNLLSLKLFILHWGM